MRDALGDESILILGVWRVAVIVLIIAEEEEERLPATVTRVMQHFPTITNRRFLHFAAAASG